MNKIEKNDAEEREAFKRKQDEESAAFYRKQHAKRLLTAIDNGYVITGLRMSDPVTDHVDGAVVTFTADEGKAIVDAVAKVIKARK